MADPFSEMANRLGLVPDTEFGGAVVIVPPGEGPAIEFLLTDPAPDIVMFWASVKSRVEIAYAMAVNAADKGQTW